MYTRSCTRLLTTPLNMQLPRESLAFFAFQNVVLQAHRKKTLLPYTAAEGRFSSVFFLWLVISFSGSSCVPLGKSPLTVVASFPLAVYGVPEDSFWRASLCMQPQSDFWWRDEHFADEEDFYCFGLFGFLCLCRCRKRKTIRLQISNAGHRFLTPELLRENNRRSRNRR